MAKKYLGTKLQELGEVSSLVPTDKIVIVKPKDEGVMALSEFFYYVTSNLDLSNYYTALEADVLFSKKKNVYTKADADAKFAFIERTYTKVQSDTKYALKENTFTRESSDARYAKVTESYKKTDLYTKNETFQTFALKTEIPILPDLSPYSTTAKGDVRWAMKADTYSKHESDTRYAPIQHYYDKTESDSRFAKSITTYTKEETDTKFLNNTEGYTRTFIENNIYFKPEVYTKLETDTRFALKSNVYTIAAINEQFAPKSWVYSRGEAENIFAPISTTYTKKEVNSLVATETGALATDLSSNYYPKTETDAKYALLAQTYTRVVSDDKYARIANTLTIAQLADKYYDKIQIDTIIDALDWTPYLTKADAISTYARIDTVLSKNHIQTTYYTKAQVDDAIRAAEQGLEKESDARYITAGWADGRYANLNNVYSIVDSDAHFATLALTYSVIDADAKFATKTGVTTEIQTTRDDIVELITDTYLPLITAANVYLNKTDATSLYYEKSMVYTKAESESRYAPMLRSYDKAEADSRFYKLGLDSLDLVTNDAASIGSSLNFKNSSTSNLESGRVTWDNSEFELGHVKVTNTVDNKPEFSVNLKPNYTAPTKVAIRVNTDYIEHAVYGRLHNYFAKASETYTQAVIDDMIDTITTGYLSVDVARISYVGLDTHNTLANEVTTLTATVTQNKTNANNTYATKSNTYTKSESDGRYLSSANKMITLTDTITDPSQLGISFNNLGTNATSGGLVWLNQGNKTAQIHAEGGSSGSGVVRMHIRDEQNNFERALNITTDYIWHKEYGFLDSYFALSTSVYTKAQADANLTSFANLIYTKLEADTRFASKQEFESVGNRVTTEETRLNNAMSDIEQNHYKKTDLYTKTQSDDRYIQKTDGYTKSQSDSRYFQTNKDINLNNRILSFNKTSDTNIDHIWYDDISSYFYFCSDVEYKSKDQSGNIRAGIGHFNGQLYSKGILVYNSTESDSRYYKKSDVYTQAQANARYAYKEDNYTKLEIDDRYYTKSQIDSTFVKLWSGSQATYNSISVKDPNTLYIIV